MKSYPSITGEIRRGVPVYVFDKLDGSNVRAEWTRKRGFHKFGKRTTLLDPAYDVTPFLCEAPDLIVEDFSDDLGEICRLKRWDKATFFFEFWGPSSFAGVHVDEPHRVTLIDVAVHRRGWMPARDFVRTFMGLDHATLLHHGNFTQKFQRMIETGTLPGMTFEGVVCKGTRSNGLPFMFKRKSEAWLQKLRERCEGDDKLYERLR